MKRVGKGNKTKKKIDIYKKQNFLFKYLVLIIYVKER